jgi:hypothetical protein
MLPGFLELKEPEINQSIDCYKPFAWGAGHDKITEYWQIANAAGVHKFSKICGFTFISNIPGDYKMFQIVFKPAYRSDIFRQKRETMQSRWYIVIPLDKDGRSIQIIDKRTLLKEYNFDVDAFMESKTFKYWVKRFQEVIDATIVKAEMFIDKNILTLDRDKLKNIPFASEHKAIINNIKDTVEMLPKPNVNDKTYHTLYI